MSDPVYIAVDLGAGSGRVFLAGVEPEEFFLIEIYRFRYPPRESAGHLRWDFSLILTEIKVGLAEAGQKAQELGREIRSIGIDSWGVDHGLIAADGTLLADPICYRDVRTTKVMERVLERVPRERLYQRTGIQLLPFNTLFQLYAGKDDLEGAAMALLLPDLVGYLLTGTRVSEFTNATTTQMVSAASRDWDRELLEWLELPSGLFPEIVPAGTDLGPLLPAVGAELGLDGVHVVAPATHDTGSAVAGAPLGRRTAYISSGTWSLIGVELKQPLINREAARLNFTNEGGAFGTTRFLKNVMGLWIFESCRKEWQADDIAVDYEDLISGVRSLDGFDAVIFPDDDRFLNPENMLRAIALQLKETGQPLSDDPVWLSKVIFDSLALRYASVLASIERVTKRVVEDVMVLGGGGRNDYLNQMTADASVRPVFAGLTEATVVGNVLVQAIASGRFASLAEGREHVKRHAELREFTPRRSAALEDIAERYSAIEAKYAA